MKIVKSGLKRTESMVQFKSNANLILKPWIQYFSKLKSIINWMNYNFDANIRVENCNMRRNFTMHSQCKEMRYPKRKKQSGRHSMQEPTVRIWHLLASDKNIWKY